MWLRTVNRGEALSYHGVCIFSNVYGLIAGGLVCWGVGRWFSGSPTRLHDYMTAGLHYHVCIYGASNHVVSKNTQLTSPRLHSADRQWNPKYSSSEKAQTDPPCRLLSVTRTCFCEFYRQLHTAVSRIATLKARGHWAFVPTTVCGKDFLPHTVPWSCVWYG